MLLTKFFGEITVVNIKIVNVVIKCCQVVKLTLQSLIENLSAMAEKSCMMRFILVKLLIDWMSKVVVD